MTKLESLNFIQAGLALELIRQRIILKDRFNKVAPNLGEFFWTSSILKKLLPFYPHDAKLLMQQRDYTLHLVHRYFFENVFDLAQFEPNNIYMQMLSPSDPLCNVISSNINRNVPLNVTNNVPFLYEGRVKSKNTDFFSPLLITLEWRRRI